MSTGANDWRNCLNCRYMKWEKDERAACHRDPPHPDSEDDDFGVWPVVNNTCFCHRHQPNGFLWGIEQWIKWWWRTM